MLRLKQTLPVMLLSLFLFSSNSLAEQSYQFEVTGGYEKDGVDTSTNKFTTLLAEIYFSPINTKNIPLAESAFLSKSSSVSIGYIKVNSDFQNSDLNSIDGSGPLFAIDYITETGAFIIGATYSTTDIEADPDVITDDIEITGIEIGKYLSEYSTVRFSYTSTDTEVQNALSSQSDNLDIESYRLESKAVLPLDATSYYHVSAGVELNKRTGSSLVKEEYTELFIFGEYFFTLMTSIGAVASYSSSDYDSGEIFGIGGTHFFTPQIALNITLPTLIASRTKDADSFSIDVIARF